MGEIVKKSGTGSFFDDGIVGPLLARVEIR